MALSPRLCACLSNGVFDSRLNSNNSCWQIIARFNEWSFAAYAKNLISPSGQSWYKLAFAKQLFLLIFFKIFLNTRTKLEQYVIQRMP